MPKITIWVREEDIDKWKALYSPEWLHELLNEPAIEEPTLVQEEDL
jgi:hypothetical protein